MAEPDVRVDTTALDRAGADVARTGAAIAATARQAAALSAGSAGSAEPAWSDGFDSVGATARLGALWREALVRDAADVEACGTAMRRAAAAWQGADQAVAESMRVD